MSEKVYIVLDSWDDEVIAFVGVFKTLHSASEFVCDRMGVRKSSVDKRKRYEKWFGNGEIVEGHKILKEEVKQ